MMERVRRLPPPDLANTAAWHCQMAGLPRPCREYRFRPDRRWRLDLAWPKERVAVEIHGGEWTGGRHNRQIGADCEKARALALEGWLLLSYTGSQMRDAPGLMVAEIRQALEMRK